MQPEERSNLLKSHPNENRDTLREVEEFTQNFEANENQELYPLVNFEEQVTLFRTRAFRRHDKNSRDLLRIKVLRFFVAFLLEIANYRGKVLRNCNGILIKKITLGYMCHLFTLNVGKFLEKITKVQNLEIMLPHLQNYLQLNLKYAYETLFLKGENIPVVGLENYFNNALENDKIKNGKNKNELENIKHAEMLRDYAYNKFLLDVKRNIRRNNIFIVQRNTD